MYAGALQTLKPHVAPSPARMAQWHQGKDLVLSRHHALPGAVGPKR